MEEGALLMAGRGAMQTLKTIVGEPTKDAQGFELTSAAHGGVCCGKT
jgi:hypothetical protein